MYDRLYRILAPIDCRIGCLQASACYDTVAVCSRNSGCSDILSCSLQKFLLLLLVCISYFVTGIPDADKRSKADIIIEERDPQQVLCYRGINNTLPGVQAIYPSFDITPPYLIDGVITDKGVYSAYDVAAYFEEDVSQFY